MYYIKVGIMRNIKLYAGFIFALSCSVSSAAFADSDGRNTYRFIYGNDLSVNVGSYLDGSKGVGAQEDVSYDNWLDFYHVYERHIDMESQVGLNGAAIEMGGLQLNASKLPDFSYPYTSVGAIDVSNNLFSDLDFLYSINNVSGSMDISGNNSLSDLGALSHLKLPSSSFVVFDTGSQYTNLMDVDSTLCTDMSSGAVGIKNDQNGSLVNGNIGDYCAVKDAWINRYHESGRYLSYLSDSKLSNQPLYFLDASWTDESIPDYNYPVPDVERIAITGTELTNLDFMKSIKSMIYTNESTSITDNPNLVNLDGLSNLVASQVYYRGTYNSNRSTAVNISNNASLKSTAGFTHLRRLVGNHYYSRLTISNNPVLTEIQSLGGVNFGTLDIRGNPSLRDYSFLSAISLRSWWSSFDGKVLLDLANMDIKPSPEDGNFCKKILDNEMMINGSGGITAMRNVCQLEPWPNLFTNELNISFQSGSKFFKVLKNSDLLSATINMNGLDITGKIPLESYPVSAVGGISFYNMYGLTDLKFLDTVNTMGVDKHFWIQGNHDLISLNGMQNIITLNYPANKNQIRILANPKLTDISALASLTTPYTLYIEQNPSLKSLVGLENVTTIASGQQIRLRDNSIENIAPLANLLAVYDSPTFSILLSGNNISDVSALAGDGLVGLNIDLSDNNLSNIEGLRGRSFRRVSQTSVALDLRGNPDLHDLSPLSDIPDGDGVFINLDKLSQYTTLLDKNGILCQRALLGRTNITFSTKHDNGIIYSLAPTYSFDSICK
jgi:hypothetical protein